MIGVNVKLALRLGLEAALGSGKGLYRARALSGCRCGGIFRELRG